MISTDAYIGSIISIILTTLFEIFKRKTRVLPFISLAMIILLTVIYKLDVTTVNIVFFINNFFPLNVPLPIELQKKGLISLFVIAQFFHLMGYYFLISRCKMEEEFNNFHFNKKILTISLFISYFIFTYLQVLLFYFMLQKFYSHPINESLIYFICGMSLYVIISLEARILYYINLYLSFKQSIKQKK